MRSLLFQPIGGHRPAEPELNSDPDDTFFVPPATDLDEPAGNMGVPLQPFGGYIPNRARLNGEDINPNSVQTMRVCYDDGIQLYNGVDGITEKRFGPSQFYLLSDLYPNQGFLVPGGHQPKQVLTASDIQQGPAALAASQPSAPGRPGGPVFTGGMIRNPGGC